MKEILHKNIIGSVTTFCIEGNGDRGTLLHTELKNRPQTALVLTKWRFSAVFACGICGAVCRILCRTKEKERKMKIDFKNLKLDVRYLDINLIKPFARNPRTHSKEHIQQIATSIMKFSWIKNSFALSRPRYQHQHEWMIFGNTESVYKELHECILLDKNLDSLIHWTCALLLSMLCITKDNICGHLNVKSWF